MKDVINIERAIKKKERRQKKELRNKLRTETRNSIWRDLVEKYGVVPQHLKDEVDGKVRAAVAAELGEDEEIKESC
jgi:hypothetical protein